MYVYIYIYISCSIPVASMFQLPSGGSVIYEHMLMPYMEC